MDPQVAARPGKGRRLPHADPGRVERGVHPAAAEREAEAGREPDRRDGRGEVEKAGHGPPRAIMASSHGPGHRLLAQNMVYGNYWDVDEAETLEPAADEEKCPKGEYFIIDVQAHFTNGAAAAASAHAEFVKQHGLQAQERRRGVRLPELRQGDVLRQRDRAWWSSPACRARRSRATPRATCREGAARTPGIGGTILPSWLMAERKQDINDMAGSQRRCARATAPRTTTGTGRPTRRTRRPCSSRWSARSRRTASTRGSGTATPTRAAPATGSSWTTRS